MNQKELEIFELCDKLANLLGDKEAIADLKALYEKHPEMFKDMKDVFNTITEITREPEIIVDATRSNKNIDIYKAAKLLDDKKMGDIVIRNDDGTNVIFHANKKKKTEFERLLKQIEAGGRDAHFLHPALKQLGLVQDAHSPTSESIISKNPKHDSLNNKNSNQTPNQSDDKSNSQADNKKQALQYLRDNKPNANPKESSNQSGKLLDPNKQNKSENKTKTRKQRR